MLTIVPPTHYGNNVVNLFQQASRVFSDEIKQLEKYLILISIEHNFEELCELGESFFFKGYISVNLIWIRGVTVLKSQAVVIIRTLSMTGARSNHPNSTSYYPKSCCDTTNISSASHAYKTFLFCKKVVSLQRFVLIRGGGYTK